MFSSKDLAGMRSCQESHMMDEGRKLTYSRTYNDFGEPVESWTPATSSVKCGLEMKAGNEIDRSTKSLVRYDAVLRLPINTVLDERDRWRITKRFGETVAEIDYWIVSPIQRGPSGVRVLLSRVEV